MAQPQPPTMHERELPMLAGIAGFFRWLEELLNILNGPLLMFGAGIALVDLLTDGALTASDQALLFAWAISQALGIDLQLLACFARARMAMLKRHGWSLLGWLLLGVPLAIATWQAGYVYAVQQSEHISEAQALAEAGMDRRVWLAWRVGLAVGLVALAGWTRYVAPRINTQQSADEERMKLEADLQLEPLRQQLRAQQARGARGVLDALRGKEAKIEPTLVAISTPAKTPKTAAVTHDQSHATRPPTGPGSPATAHTLRTPPAQADSALATVIDETPDYDEEEESSRVVHINRSRSARNVNKRLRREGKQARRTRIRDTVNTVLDQADEAGEIIDDIAINELARRVNAALSAAGDDVNTSPATVKHHRTNWLRSRQSAAVQ